MCHSIRFVLVIFLTDTPANLPTRLPPPSNKSSKCSQDLNINPLLPVFSNTNNVVFAVETRGSLPQHPRLPRPFCGLVQIQWTWTDWARSGFMTKNLLLAIGQMHSTKQRLLGLRLGSLEKTVFGGGQRLELRLSYKDKSLLY